MKILFVNSVILDYARQSPTAIGGSERQQWLLARALAARGTKVIVYVDPGQLEGDVIIENVVFRSMSSTSPVSYWKAILMRENADWWCWAAHSHWLGIVAPLARSCGTKFAFQCAFDADCQPRLALAHRRYLWPLYALGLFAANRILIQHEHQEQLLPRLLQRKAALVPYIANVTATTLERQDYIAWVASLREPKRPHLLADLARILPDTRFVVCGPVSLHRTRPEYASTIVERLTSNPNIEYRGQVSPREAQRVIENSAMLLSTSSHEGFPNTFLQAWSAGVPVISIGLDPGGVIRKTGAGMVLSDVSATASAILHLQRKQTVLNSMGKKGQDYVQQCHAEAIVIEKLIAALSTRQGSGH